MVTVSPKHHERWLNSKRVQLQKIFSFSKAKALKKSLKEEKAIPKFPKKKWTASINYYVSTFNDPQVLIGQFITGFEMSPVVLEMQESGDIKMGVFSPNGDPFLEGLITTKAISWKRIKIPDDVKAENRKQYLKKLSPSLKRQQGLIPPKKTKKGKS